MAIWPSLLLCCTKLSRGDPVSLLQNDGKNAILNLDFPGGEGEGKTVMHPFCLPGEEQQRAGEIPAILQIMERKLMLC